MTSLHNVFIVLWENRTNDRNNLIQIPLCLSGSVGPVIYSTFERKNSLPINQTLNIGAMEGRVFKIL